MKAATRPVVLDLRDDDGVVRGQLTIKVVKATTAVALGQEPLLDLRDASVDPGLQPVQLVEGARYHYAISKGLDVAHLEPSEVFEPDDEDNRTGRLVPSLFAHGLFSWAIVDFPLWRP